MKENKRKRKDSDLPESIVEWGWRYHHLGIPTKKAMPNEKYISQFKFYVSGFEHSPFGIEWMRFEKESSIHPLIQTVPHIAFEVDDIDYELANRGLTILSKPNSPSEGVKVAMIEYNGAPVELIQFKRKDS